MLKLALFDPRKFDPLNRRRAEPLARQPGAHDDFKPTQPAVLSLDLAHRVALPRARGHADNGCADAQAFLPRGAGAA